MNAHAVAKSLNAMTVYQIDHGLIRRSTDMESYTPCTLAAAPRAVRKAFALFSSAVVVYTTKGVKTEVWRR